MASDSLVILRRWHAKVTKKALLGAYLLSAGLLQAQSDLPCSTSKEPWSTASRNALPGLKWGTRFSGICTLSPDRGLRPTRGGRRLMVKLPKPRISIRWPLTKASLMASSTVLTANSASRWVKLLKAGSQSFNKVGAGHLEKRFCKRQRKSLWLSPERAKLEALIFSRSFC
jgi:hypothetical protein